MLLSVALVHVHVHGLNPTDARWHRTEAGTAVVLWVRCVCVVHVLFLRRDCAALALSL